MSIDNLESAMYEMFDFLAGTPSGLDGFDSNFSTAFQELEEVKAMLGQSSDGPLTLDEAKDILNKSCCDRYESLWLKDLETGFIAPCILDIMNGEICGVYSGGKVDYREKDYGKKWVVYRYFPNN